VLVLVIGAGRVGARVLCQLQKNPNLKILTVDPRKEPYAVQKGIIKKIDYYESLTSYTLKKIVNDIKPDIVLITTASEDICPQKVPGIEILVESLRRELAALANVPIISVSREIEK
jgi:hypothetical protein